MGLHLIEEQEGFTEESGRGHNYFIAPFENQLKVHDDSNQPSINENFIEEILSEPPRSPVASGAYKQA